MRAYTGPASNPTFTQLQSHRHSPVTLLPPHRPVAFETVLSISTAQRALGLAQSQRIAERVYLPYSHTAIQTLPRATL